MNRRESNARWLAVATAGLLAALPAPAWAQQGAGGTPGAGVETPGVLTPVRPGANPQQLNQRPLDQQQQPPGPAVGPGQAEGTADTLGVRDFANENRQRGEVPVSEGQAESIADPLGGFDDEGSQAFGDSGFLPLGQQPQVGPREGEDLQDADLRARGVDVGGTQTETGFNEADRAARGVERTTPDGFEVPLEDVDLQARGVRLQGEQVNEELFEARELGARGIEPPEGRRAGPNELPFRNAPGDAFFGFGFGGTGLGDAGFGQGAQGQAGQVGAGQAGQVEAGQAGQVGAGQAAQGGAGQTGQLEAGQAGQVGAGQAGQLGAGQVGAGQAGAGADDGIARAQQGVPAAGEGVAAAGEGVAAADQGLQPAITGGLEGVPELGEVTIEGRIIAVSYTDSIARILTEDRGVLDVRAQPQAIALMQQGDRVALNVTEVADNVWLVPAGGAEQLAQTTAGAGGDGGEAASGIFEERGQVDGVITGLSPDEGVLFVGDRMFQAHPVALQNLAPGQMVSITYGTVGDQTWAAEILVGGMATPPDTTSR